MNCFIVLALGFGVANASKSGPPPPTAGCESNLGAREALAKQFLKLSDSDLPVEIVRAYPDILALTGAVDASPFGVGIANPERDLASEKLFGIAHPEFDRTLLGLLVLKWVMNGEYDRLTSAQPEATRLTKARFDEIRAYVNEVVHDEESLDAMITSMVINDLGKAKDFVERTQRLTGVSDVDHDNVLLAAIEKDAGAIPAYAHLSERYQNVIREGLRAKFNLGQLAQAENVPPSLEGMKTLMKKKEPLDFFLVHALIDFAGVAGHVTQRGSLLLDEPKATSYLTAIEALKGLGQGQSTIEVYDAFLAKRAETFGLQKTDRAVIRLSTMLGLRAPEQAAQVKAVFEGLPSSTKLILEHEMAVTGYDDQPAILIYYAPGIVSNIRGAMEKAGASSAEALALAFKTLARAYHEARLTRPSNQKVFTVMAKDLAVLGGTDPRAIDSKTIDVVPVGDGAKIEVSDNLEIETSQLHQLKYPPSIGGRLGYIGVGGGLDGVQGAILSLMMHDTKQAKPSFVISIRSARRFANHGGEIAPGVFKITPETTSTKRFVENRLARYVNTYVVLDGAPERLVEQIRAVVNAEGGVDHIFAVDTGGDSLYKISGVDAAKATPDQDLRVLRRLADLEIPVTTAIIAPGVDTPADALDVLLEAKAKYYDPPAHQTLLALGKYREWGLDGTDPTAFGKTSLAWQAALWRDFGLHALPIPRDYLLSRDNPWNPYVLVRPNMRGILFMTLPDHLRALGVTPQLVLSREQKDQLREGTHSGAIENFFEYGLHWKVSTLDGGMAKILTNPFFKSQSVVINFTYPGSPLPSISKMEIEEMIVALDGGGQYVFEQARDHMSRALTLTDQERSDLLARRAPLRYVLERKGWGIVDIKRGQVFEYGDGWFETDWVSELMSPDGAMKITEARDFNPYLPKEVETIARALERKEDLVTDRARAALDSESDVIPGDNPRSKMPPRD